MRKAQLPWRYVNDNLNNKRLHQAHCLRVLSVIPFPPPKFLSFERNLVSIVQILTPLIDPRVINTSKERPNEQTAEAEGHILPVDKGVIHALNTPLNCLKITEQIDYTTRQLVGRLVGLTQHIVRECINQKQSAFRDEY